MDGKIRSLSSTELGTIAKELGILVGSYFKNFYELKEGSFLITFSKERKEIAVYVNLARTINITKFKEGGSSPTDFALNVRKKLEGSKVESVEQHGSDRIIVFKLAGREEKKIVVEMFDKGNLIVTNAAGVIELAHESRSFKERSIRKGMLYSFPIQRGKAAKTEAKVDTKGHATLSEMLDAEYMEERSTSINPEKKREIEELQKSMEKLRKQIEQMKQNGEDQKKIGNRIFERMNEINTLLEHARKTRPKNAAELGGFGNINVKRVDPKNKTLTIELD